MVKHLNGKPILIVGHYYGSPTSVTRLTVVPNMADPISIRDSDSNLNVRII